jgi:hypothetical protein
MAPEASDFALLWLLLCLGMFSKAAAAIRSID